MAARPAPANMAAPPAESPDLAEMTVKELRMWLDELGIPYHHRAGRPRLSALLTEALASDDSG
jgi:hypothetical protein